MDMSTPVRKQLTLEEYRALPKEERTILRRAAFGAPVPAHVTAEFDLDHLKAVLDADNEATGEFPTKWTDQPEDEEMAEYLR